MSSTPLETYFVSEWAHYFIFGSAILSIVWGIVNVLMIRNIDITDPEPIKAFYEEEAANGINDEEGGDKSSQEKADEIIAQLKYIGDLITTGAKQFLWAEYFYLTLFCLVFSLIIGFTVDWNEMSTTTGPKSNFPFTAVAFLVGALTSIICGYIGMIIAVYTNSRTTYECCKGEELTVQVPNIERDEAYLDLLAKFHDITSSKAKEAEAEMDKQNTSETKEGKVKDLKAGFMTAFAGGQVLGFCLVGLALLILEVILLVYKAAWFDIVIKDVGTGAEADTKAAELVRRNFEFVAGYGLGGSPVAIFDRVGGGIYTKAADVGADLVGKVVAGLEEDSPENPGTIADNVGDNVGDIAGMGADLFGSLAESTCAALVVSSTSIDLVKTKDALYFPLIVTSVGIIASFLSVLCANFFTVTVYTVQNVLKAQLAISTIIMTIALVPFINVLPETFEFKVNAEVKTTSRW